MKTNLKLVCRQDGTVAVEIRTGQPLDAFFYDRPLREVLNEPAAFELEVTGTARSWRYPHVRCNGPVGGRRQKLVDRMMDLSDGSEERRMLTLMVRQRVISIAWVHEQIEARYTLGDSLLPALREAIENTRGVSREDWDEELAEYEWETSESWRPGPRPGKLRRRRATKPDPPIPFFAPVSGTIPRARAPEIDGVKLPQGRRHPSRTPAYWATTAPVGNLELMLPWLASQFGSTGLWPLLWPIEEVPDAYMGGHGDLDSIDAVDPVAALRERWGEQRDPDATDPFDEFPGLADGTPWSADTLQEPHPDAGDPARVLLVPCNRPADAITVLGGLAVAIEAPVISSVLRSWEQRFAAVPYKLAPSALSLAVGAPPGSHTQGMALAAELYALCAPSNAGLTVRAIANNLLDRSARPAETPGIDIGPTSWTIAWLD
jgi:hypothetical protein